MTKTAAKMHVLSGPLMAEDDVEQILSSDLINDFEPVFTGLWFSDKARPRFGDQVWEVAGLDPTDSLGTVKLDFTDLSPQWSLIAREMAYIRSRPQDFRDRIGQAGTQPRHREFRSQSVATQTSVVRFIAQVADELNIGLPSLWTDQDVERLSEYVRERKPQYVVGRVVKRLFEYSNALTLGGLSFDPTEEEGVTAWAGDTPRNSGISTVAIDPQDFHDIVGNAIFYLLVAAPDILAALAWLKTRPKPGKFVTYVSRNHPVRQEYSDVVGGATLALHKVIVDLGGIPAATTTYSTERGMRVVNPGEPCLATLMKLAGGQEGGRARHLPFVHNRIDSGTPLVAGGIPIPITASERPDGTVGPWRDPLCLRSIRREGRNLANACKIVVMAFTAMRDSELNHIPRHGWRTTWMDCDAITAPLIKNAYGEELKWWVTPMVIRACEALEQLALPEADFLFDSVGIKTMPSDWRRNVNFVNHASVNQFVRHMQEEPALHGFHEMNVGWNLDGDSSTDGRPHISPHRFRTTLSSISRWVEMGDAAFQQQAKHAFITMSHSYMANGGTDAWRNQLMNSMTNEKAAKSAEAVVEIFQSVWSRKGDPLAGHSGRELTRTIKDLLDKLPLDPFDPDADVSMTDQFATQVIKSPDLAQAIRDEARIYIPGTVNDCFRIIHRQKCTEKTEPNLGLCFTENCANVVFTTAQQPKAQERLDLALKLLENPDMKSQQRAVFERKAAHLQAQLRTEGNPFDGHSEER